MRVLAEIGARGVDGQRLVTLARLVSQAVLVERNCLRVETRKGWHVYVATAAPEGVRELNVGGDVKIDLLCTQRNGAVVYPSKGV